MKKFIFIILVTILMTSCTANLPRQFTRLADKVEAKGSTFTQEQWDKFNEKFEALIDKYEDCFSDLTSSERKEINSAIARYSKEAISSGMKNVTDEIGSLFEKIPDVINDFVEEAKGFLEGLGL